ncbi:MAG: hypothetical protein JHC88_20385 [Niveispirillum sp.]|nr:hypothetical protein [Niveispirillum sp.]
MVPWSDTRHAGDIARDARLRLVDRGGHLVHEVRADMVAGLIADAIQARPASRVDAA